MLEGFNKYAKAGLTAYISHKFSRYELMEDVYKRQHITNGQAYRNSPSVLCNLRSNVHILAVQRTRSGSLRVHTSVPFYYLSRYKACLLYTSGQMIEDVRLAVNGKVKVEHFGRLGGIVPDPDEIVEALAKLKIEG